MYDRWTVWLLIFGAVFACLVSLAVVGPWLSNKAHHRKHGWHVELVFLDIEIDIRPPVKFAVAYFEGAGNCLCLFGEMRKDLDGRLDVPSEHGWDARVPEFARQRRAEILSRLQEQRAGMELYVTPYARVEQSLRAIRTK